MTPRQIDDEVRARLAAGDDLYRLDEGALRDLDPDLVVTQDLCAACAVDVGNVDAALQHLGCRAQVLTVDPGTLEEVLVSILTVGGRSGQGAAAGTAGRRVAVPATLGDSVGGGSAATAGCGVEVDRPAVHCGALGAGDLRAKPRAQFETVDDLDEEPVTFGHVPRDRGDELETVCALTPHSRAGHAAASDLDVIDELDRARRVWARLGQGRGGMLRRTGWRSYRDAARRTGSVPWTLTAYVDWLQDATERLAVGQAQRHRTEVLGCNRRLGNHDLSSAAAGTT